MTWAAGAVACGLFLVGFAVAILHGDADRILPPDATSRRQAKMLKNVRFVELSGGPHGVLWTHADLINSELVSFLA
jgi:pimeloyl-ACP methyl ester carboxylesterase